MEQLELNTMGPRADFSFPLRVSAFFNIASVLLSIIPLHPLPLFYQYLNFYQKQIYGQTFGFGAYTTHLSPSRFKYDHPACLLSGSA
jgi:hypothetical protein